MFEVSYVFTPLLTFSNFFGKVDDKEYLNDIYVNLLIVIIFTFPVNPFASHPIKHLRRKVK